MADEHPSPLAGRTSPVLAPLGASAAEASRPETQLESAQYHIYESHPVPWWIALLWGCFFIFGVTYLILSLIE